jgi:hypothetical protein
MTAEGVHVHARNGCTSVAAEKREQEAIVTERGGRWKVWCQKQGGVEFKEFMVCH